MRIAHCTTCDVQCAMCSVVYSVQRAILTAEATPNVLVRAVTACLEAVQAGVAYMSPWGTGVCSTVWYGTEYTLHFTSLQCTVYSILLSALSAVPGRQCSVQYTVQYCQPTVQCSTWQVTPQVELTLSTLPPLPPWNTTLHWWTLM